MSNFMTGKIAFASGKTGDYDIWTLDLASREMQQLTYGADWNDKPKWSPDGQWIAFVSHRSGFAEIFKVPAAGGDLTQLTQLNRWATSPAFSPDGTRIAFISNESGNNDIWIMDVEGNQRTQITRHEGSDSHVEWTTDGRGLLWSSDRADGDADVWHIDLDSHEKTQLNSEHGADITPAASPDGRWIAFCSDRQFTPDPNRPFADRDKDIWLMAIDGKLPVRLTASQGSDYAPCWAPDGKHLLYTASDKRKACHLRVMDLSAVLAAYETGDESAIDDAADAIRAQSVELDRTDLKAEIGAHRNATFVTGLLPESWVAACYPAQYFGLERNPHWIAAKAAAAAGSDAAQMQPSAV